MSDDQRNNFIEARVLNLVLGQAGEQFKPAQEMARKMFEVHNHGE